MVIYVFVNKDNHIESWGTSNPGYNSIKIEIEEDHPFFNDIPLKYIVDNENKIILSNDAEQIEEKIINEQKHKELIESMTPTQDERIEQLEQVVLYLLREE